MKSTIFAASALLSTSYAASVHLATTGCVNPPNNPLEEFDIDIVGAADKPVVQAINNVCGIKIVSATDGVDVNSVQCQAYQDVDGTQYGSALFSYASPALIATNPVQEASIRCVITPTIHLATTGCVNPSNNPLEEFDIQASEASDRAIMRPIKNVCGIKIVSVSEGADISAVSCQAFKDAEGTQPGSAVFTYASPALIATNPVQEQSIRCVVAAAPQSAHKRRQAVVTSSTAPSSSVAVSSASVSSSTSISTSISRSASASGSASVTGSSPVSSSTAFSNSSSTASSSGASTTAQTTLLTTKTIDSAPTNKPTNSQSSALPKSTNAAAGSFAMSAGLGAAAFAALLL